MLRTDTGYVRNVNWVFVAIISVILVVATWQIRGILLYTFASILLVIFFTFPIRWLFDHTRLNRGLAILVSVFGSIVVIILLASLVFPTLFVQFRELTTDVIPRGFEQLLESWNSGEIFEEVPLLESILGPDAVEQFEITDEQINTLINQLGTALGTVGGTLIPFLGDVASVVLGVLVIFFLSMYFLAEPDRYIDGVITLTPLWYRSRTREIFMRLDSVLRAWIGVTAISMIVVGVGTGIGLALLGIREWAALGVLAGVMSFIPNFGPIAALVPALAVAAVQAPERVGWVFVVIYGVSFVQSQVIAPILADENMNLAPVMILVGQIVFGIFFGFLGIMLAVPLTAVVVTLVNEIYVKDVLGDTGIPEESPAEPEMIELQPETD